MRSDRPRVDLPFGLKEKPSVLYPFFFTRGTVCPASIQCTVTVLLVFHVDASVKAIRWKSSCMDRYACARSLPWILTVRDTPRSHSNGLGQPVYFFVGMKMRTLQPHTTVDCCSLSETDKTFVVSQGVIHRLYVPELNLTELQ